MHSQYAKVFLLFGVIATASPLTAARFHQTQSPLLLDLCYTILQPCLLTITSVYCHILGLSGLDTVIWLCCCLVTVMPLVYRLAAKLGGGNLVAPVQRVTDFLAGQLSSGALPSSSYRSG